MDISMLLVVLSYENNNNNNNNCNRWITFSHPIEFAENVTRACSFSQFVHIDCKCE